jgi:hypothetical protein
MMKMQEKKKKNQEEKKKMHRPPLLLLLPLQHMWSVLAPCRETLEEEEKPSE